MFIVMPPRDFPDHLDDLRHSLPTKCFNSQLWPTVSIAAAPEQAQPPLQYRFTLPSSQTAADLSVNRSFCIAHPPHISLSDRSTRPHTTNAQSEHRYNFHSACRVPSGPLRERQLTFLGQDNAGRDNSNCFHQKDRESPNSIDSTGSTPACPSLPAIMSVAGSFDLLPRMGSGNGMHSPFSIPHPLFNHVAGPSSSNSLPRSPLAGETKSLASLGANGNGRKNAALLDALAGPSIGMQPSVSSNSFSAAHPSSFDLSQDAGSSFSASGSFGGSGSSGAVSSSNGRTAGREGPQRSSGSDDRGESGGNGDDGSKDSADKEKAKKTNPLVDLLETEAAYVSELSKVIKKVAAAWSRSNFPPPELDTMFRNIEAIYRANRSFLKALKEIGPNPSSPKALGDLLMKWIDDLETPYSRFCENYLSDFDAWPAVQSNPRLASLLEEVSGATDSEGNPVIFSDRKRDPNEPWTLDSLFALPHIRLKYYKKLYSRLLKSTQPGRSDHRLLVGANEKLDELVDKSKRRLAISVLEEAVGRESHDSSFAESNVTSETSPRDRVSSATSTSDSQSPSVRPVQTFGISSSSSKPCLLLLRRQLQAVAALPPSGLLQRRRCFPLLAAHLLPEVCPCSALPPHSAKASILSQASLLRTLT